MAESTKQEIANIPIKAASKNAFSATRATEMKHSNAENAVNSRPIKFNFAYRIQLCLSFKERSYQCQNCIKVSQNIQDVLESIFFASRMNSIQLIGH